MVALIYNEMGINSMLLKAGSYTSTMTLSAFGSISVWLAAPNINTTKNSQPVTPKGWLVDWHRLC
ncbi:hypothetical protein NRIC_09450 [Enterococcus florum]|uniref:Uncharacterized protein n=1 Tax=Enterococcus florum TaxID=2480627 RepID=A0A4P5P9P9_9ENTE|nr:hypothetical protein NRIC_09450 [Enterococcus florum]